MLKDACQVGQKVYFGRSNGEQTLGKIIKINDKKARVEILEERGRGRGGDIGCFWSVPYSMMKLADQSTALPPTPVTPKEPIKYIPFAHLDNIIMEGLLCVYCGLSPENLCSDGEASRSQIQQRSAELNRQLRGFKLALGREVSETEVYEWETQKRQYEQERQKKAV